ncbi:MAG: glycosyltransferase family 4 protein [Chitinophagales bacterium]|nr:glycosyltransferase family 4 protein [Chitinophagales bacterium]
MEAKKITFISNHYTIYNTYLFDEIRKDPDFDLKEVYLKLTKESHPVDKAEISDNNFIDLSNNKAYYFKLIKNALFKNDQYFIIAGWNHWFYISMILILSLRNSKYSIFTDTPKNNKGSFKFVIKKLFLKYILSTRKKSSILVTGNIGRDLLLAMYDISPDKVYNFPFTTNIDFFKPSERILDENIIFGSVGRVVFNHKGQDIAIKALGILKEKGFSNFQYYIAGDGSDMDKLIKLISEYNLKDNVYLEGWKQYHELPRFYNKLDFLLHTSHVDPFPNAVLEAMSCGVPIIGSDKAGSVIERVINEYDGFIHESNNINSLIDILTFVFGLEKYRIVEMGNNARKKALEWGPAYNMNILRQLIYKSNEN